VTADEAHSAGPWPWSRRQPELSFISKDDCPLCCEALEVVRALRSRLPFRLTLRKLEDAPELAELYRDQVPVILIDGRKRFWGRVDPAQLRRALKIASKTKPPEP
jgi:hypothetical protein